jgi:hypothetical protein
MGLKRQSNPMPKNLLKIPQPKIPLSQKSFIWTKIFYDLINKKPAKNP